LSADGLTVAIGARLNDGTDVDSGHTRIFRYDGVTELWKQLGQDIDGEVARDQSGGSVSLSADGLIVAIGARFNDGRGGRSGHTRVYHYDDVTELWEQLGGDINGKSTSDQSGISVSLSADGFTVAIGAHLNDGSGADSGHARILRYDETAARWAQLGGDIRGETFNDQSGRAVSLSADGSMVAIGAIRNDGTSTNAGHARIFRYDEAASEWEQVGLDIDGEAMDDLSGIFVSLSADGLTVAIGATDNDGNGSNAGHTRIFRYDEITEGWEQLGLDIDGEAANDESGGAVSLSADGLTVAIGARLNDGNGSKSGQTRIYRFNEAQSYFIAENTDAITDVMAIDDVDSENSGLIYSLSGADADRFSIDENTGELTFLNAPDFEMPADDGEDNVYDVTVTVTDQGLLSDTSSLVIKVIDLEAFDPVRRSTKTEMLSDGSIQVTFAGVPYLEHLVEASETLKPDSWAPQTVRANAEGQVIYLDEDPPDIRFYRALIPTE